MDQLTDQATSALGNPILDNDHRALKKAVHAFEKSIISDSLKANNGDKRKVARLLGISISSLYRKMGEPVPEHEEEEVMV